MGRFTDETQHTVTITRSYFMSQQEITQGQWKELSGGLNPSYFQNTTCTSGGCRSSENANDSGPVEYLDWYSAIGFANAKSRAEGLTSCYALTGCADPTNGWKDGVHSGCTNATFAGLTCTGYRLPTESEWEYAARGGTTTATYQGNLSGTVTDCTTAQANLDGIAWWCRNSDDRTKAVGGKTANSFGLSDMLGNVWEWTGDRYATYPGTVTDPLGAGTGSSRVVRGGSWDSSARYARAAARHGDTPGDRSFYLGFRLARTAPARAFRSPHREGRNPGQFCCSDAQLPQSTSESRLLHRSDRAVTLCKQPARRWPLNSSGALRMRLLLLLFCLLLAAPAAAAPFSAAAYDACVDRIGASDERLFAAKPEEEAAARQEAISVRAACVPQFEEWLTQPGLPDEVREPMAGSLVGVLAEITFLSANAGQCLQARGWLKRWRAAPNFDETANGFVKTKAAVDKCGSQPQTTVVQAPAPQVTAPSIVNATAAPLPVSPRSRALRNWGYGLLGVGALAGVGGILFDNAGAGDRDEYTTLTAACVAGTPSCDQARRITLATTIEDAKMPLLTIYGLAGVAALTGATFVTLDLMDEDDSRTTRLLLSPTAIQVAIRW